MPSKPACRRTPRERQGPAGPRVLKDPRRAAVAGGRLRRRGPLRDALAGRRHAPAHVRRVPAQEQPRRRRAPARQPGAPVRGRAGAARPRGVLRLWWHGRARCCRCVRALLPLRAWCCWRARAAAGSARQAAPGGDAEHGAAAQCRARDQNEPPPPPPPPPPPVVEPPPLVTLEWWWGHRCFTTECAG